MAINFPTDLDSLTNPSASNYLNSPSHSQQHADANDAIEALEAKVGKDGSSVTSSHDYKLGEVTGTDKAVGKSATQTLTNKTLDSAVLNGSLSGTAILDEDDMASDDDTKVPTQQSVKAYVDNNSTTLTLTEAPSSNQTQTGLKVEMTAGESLSYGDIVYFKSDGKCWKADADSSSTAPAFAIAIESISADASGDFILLGILRNDSWNWTVGGKLYLSTTAGEITQTQPTGTDDVIQVLGIATHADRIYFNPTLSFITHT